LFGIDRRVTARRTTAEFDQPLLQFVEEHARQRLAVETVRR